MHDIQLQYVCKLQLQFACKQHTQTAINLHMLSLPVRLYIYLQNQIWGSHTATTLQENHAAGMSCTAMHFTTSSLTEL